MPDMTDEEKKAAEDAAVKEAPDKVAAEAEAKKKADEEAAAKPEVDEDGLRDFEVNSAMLERTILAALQAANETINAPKGEDDNAKVLAQNEALRQKSVLQDNLNQIRNGSVTIAETAKETGIPVKTLISLYSSSSSVEDFKKTVAPLAEKYKPAAPVKAQEQAPLPAKVDSGGNNGGGDAEPAWRKERTSPYSKILTAFK